MEKKWVNSIGFGLIIISVLLAASVFITAQQRDVPSQVPLDVPATLGVLDPPEVVRDGGEVQISYDLLISGMNPEEMELVRLEVLDSVSHQTLHLLQGEELDRTFTPSPDGGSISLEYVCPVPGLPKPLTHRLMITRTGRTALPSLLSGGDIVVNLPKPPSEETGSDNMA